MLWQRRCVGFRNRERKAVREVWKKRRPAREDIVNWSERWAIREKKGDK